MQLAYHDFIFVNLATLQLCFAAPVLTWQYSCWPRRQPVSLTVCVLFFFIWVQYGGVFIKFTSEKVPVKNSRRCGVNSFVSDGRLHILHTTAKRVLTVCGHFFFTKPVGGGHLKQNCGRSFSYLFFQTALMTNDLLLFKKPKKVFLSIFLEFIFR